MKIRTLHEWPGNAADAVKIQLKLSVKVIIESTIRKPETVTAVDTAFDSNNNQIYASAVTFSFPYLNELEYISAKKKAGFPYVSGLMAFREGPAILKALSKLKQTPEIIIYHGHGLAHPRFFGMASHLGVLTEVPSVGCTVKPLVGIYNEPRVKKGGRTSVYFKDFEVGCVYRSRTDVKPIYISPGHLCNVCDAVNIIAACLTSYRMPEPLRIAHLYANKYKRLSADQSKPPKE